MAIQRTEGIILRRQEVRETSLLLIAFTRDLGKIHGLVKGVRGGRAAVPWVLEPLTHQTMILYERRRSLVDLVSACDLLDAFEPIHRDLTRMSYALFCLDLVDAMTEREDPHPEIFELLLSTLRALAKGADPKSAARYLEAHLLSLSGLLGSVQSQGLSPGGTLTLKQILETPPDRLSRLRLSRGVEEELRGLLQSLTRRTLERELKSQNFLYELALEGPVAA